MLLVPAIGGRCTSGRPGVPDTRPGLPHLPQREQWIAPVRRHPMAICGSDLPLGRYRYKHSDLGTVSVHGVADLWTPGRELRVMWPTASGRH